MANTPEERAAEIVYGRKGLAPEWMTVDESGHISVIGDRLEDAIADAIREAVKDVRAELARLHLDDLKEAQRAHIAAVKEEREAIFAEYNLKTGDDLGFFVKRPEPR